MSESAPRISDEMKKAGRAAIEALYDRPQGTAETEEIVDAVAEAILPLLDDDRLQQALERECDLKLHAQADARFEAKRAASAWMELEQVRAEADRAELVAQGACEELERAEAKLSQVREEVGKELRAALSVGGEAMPRINFCKRLNCILDSSSSLSGEPCACAPEGPVASDCIEKGCRESRGVPNQAPEESGSHEFDLPYNPWPFVSGPLLSEEMIRELTKQIVEGSDGQVISLSYEVVKDALADVFRRQMSLSEDVEERGEEEADWPRPLTESELIAETIRRAKSIEAEVAPSCEAGLPNGIARAQGEHNVATLLRELLEEPTVTQPSTTGNSLSGEPGDREPSRAHLLTVTENPETNERRYRCSACDTEFMVPLDDAALPAERECDGCHRYLRTDLTQPKDTHLSPEKGDN